MAPAVLSSPSGCEQCADAVCLALVPAFLYVFVGDFTLHGASGVVLRAVRRSRVAENGDVFTEITGVEHVTQARGASRWPASVPTNQQCVTGGVFEQGHTSNKALSCSVCPAWRASRRASWGFGRSGGSGSVPWHLLERWRRGGIHWARLCLSLAAVRRVTLDAGVE